jgi:hypothetical protein
MFKLASRLASRSTTFLASLALHPNTLCVILRLDRYARKGYQETYRSFSATLLVASLSGCQHCLFIGQLTGAHHFAPNDIPSRKIFVGELAAFPLRKVGSPVRSLSL